MNSGHKIALRTVVQIISTSILILSLGLAMFLSYRGTAVSSALAAPLPGIPVDSVTWVKTTETFNFNTPNDPTDDSIDYVPNTGYTGSDTIVYEICDATPECDQATVNITIDPVILVISIDSPKSLSANLAAVPVAVDDNVTMYEDTWVNIDVLDNDDFGTDGPGIGPITIVTPPTNGTATVNDGPRSPDPSGLAYLAGHTNSAYTNTLLISDSEVEEITPPNEAAYAGVNLFVTNLLGALASTLTTYNPPDVDFSSEPSGVAYNPGNNFLYFADDANGRIHELDPGSDNEYNTSDDIIFSYNTSILSGGGSVDPSGIAFDTSRGNGHLIVAGDITEEIYDIDLGVNGELDNSDTFTHFDTTSLGIRNPEGVEFNPDNCSLFVQSSRKFDHLIAETTRDGHLLRYLDIAGIDGGSHATLPAGLAYAPASSNPSGRNLYIVARGVDNNTDPLENDGKMFEVSFDNNAPPYVYAGPDDWTVFPNSIPLDGTMTDGCLPVPVGVTTTWSVTSGPGIVTFGDPNLLDTTASFSTFGDYVLKLSADDGGTHIVSDEVTIMVIPPGNQPPDVNAGLDQEIILPNSALLDGTVTDDGLPNPPASFTTTWSKQAGPGTVTFGDAAAVDTIASFSIDGAYILKLEAFDGALTSTDFVQITVNAAGNQPPTVDAGPPQTITILQDAVLDGTVNDDGLPNPPGAVTKAWSKVVGPGVVTFADPTAEDTTASFSVVGVYTLRLTANDSDKSGFDEITITVQSAKEIWLPIILKH